MTFSRSNIKSFSFDELTARIVDLGLKKYRAGQVFEWVYKNHALSFEEMTNISKSERGLLANSFHFSYLKIIQAERSADGTRKFLLELHDGHTIESVLIPDNDRLTLCISSQVGCKQACRFCLTGRGGFTKNLAAYEIVDQVLRAEEYLAGGERGGTREEGRGKKRPPSSERAKRAVIPPSSFADASAPRRITNIVLMGMGEPLANYDEVMKALGIITANKGLGFSPRRVTLSTAGLVPEIARLGQSGVRVNLAVSLNAATDAVRDMIMPVNRRYPLNELIAVCRRYPLEPRRRITYEYVMIKGVNDSPEDARRLSGLLRGIRCKVNLIPFNPFPGSEFERPDDTTVQRFQKILLDSNFAAPVRSSRGRDISAACGQLRERPARDDGREKKEGGNSLPPPS